MGALSRATNSVWYLLDRRRIGTGARLEALKMRKSIQGYPRACVYPGVPATWNSLEAVMMILRMVW